jgi:hypothetical protein
MGFFSKSKAGQPESSHPALRLEAEMDKDTVIGLLGRDHRSTTRGLLEYWLYSDDRYDIEIIFRSGALKSAEIKKKAGGKNVSTTTVVRCAEIDQEGSTAVEVGRVVNGRWVPAPERPEWQATGMTEEVRQAAAVIRALEATGLRAVTVRPADPDDDQRYDVYSWPLDQLVTLADGPYPAVAARLLREGYFDVEALLPSIAIHVLGKSVRG